MKIKTVTTVGGVNPVYSGATDSSGLNRYRNGKDYWGFAYSDGRNNFVLKL